ncbi:MAG TPA: energy transducer TonB [Candidatus Omnitrophota bacterium]|nr:energy transducer TonB [Candidatus Omnitrophota bacterium]
MKRVRTAFAIAVISLGTAGTGNGAPEKAATPERAISSSIHLTDPALFSRLLRLPPPRAYRLAPARSDTDTVVVAATDSFGTGAELHTRPDKALRRLLGMLASCSWVRVPGWPGAAPPTLRLHWSEDSLGIDLLVSLEGSKAALFKPGEGALSARLPDSLRTDLAWCLWAYDSRNPEALPVIESAMLHKGLAPSQAPPPDIWFLQGITDRSIPEATSKQEYDTPPEVVSQITPVYPEMAREAKIEGTVLLRVRVAASGRVQDVKVIRSVNYLDASARDAVAHWVYKPALLHGTPVPVWIDVPVEFHP